MILYKLTPFFESHFFASLIKIPAMKACINIYQLFPRLFGNKNTQTTPYGTIHENGCGKFSDINVAAIESLRDLGITHIWLTGIIRHATLTDYADYGIPPSHPAVVKGRAGSPYAISDYYDVDPDLATDPGRRMEEFTELIERIHKAGLQVLIDFVPNHLARQYQSVAMPNNVRDFGTDDDTSVFFKPSNNFYYIVNERFVPPSRESDPLALAAETSYNELPAKVTGNDCYAAQPSINDWYETIKLNYGIDFFNAEETHFNPVPDTWKKMLHIVQYWTGKGVDGFRTDMSEMVPVEFWKWLIQNLRKDHKALLFIAEIYQPSLYKAFIEAGFDYLYDKVGLYNTMEQVLKHEEVAESLSACWKKLPIADKHMLRFLENHDEPRLASPHLAGDAFASLPAVAVSALMHTGPFMVYNGQEFGEKAAGSPGYSGDDGRTSIFDYTHMPSMQNWIRDGGFDSSFLDLEQKQLRNFYRRILHLRQSHLAFSEGAFYDLMWANPWYTEFDPRYVYAFMRFTDEEAIVVVANFNRSESRSMRLKIPQDALQAAGLTPKKATNWIAINLLNPDEMHTFDLQQISTGGIQIFLQCAETVVFKLKSQD
jgi:glycosidase